MGRGLDKKASKYWNNEQGQINKKRRIQQSKCYGKLESREYDYTKNERQHYQQLMVCNRLTVGDLETELVELPQEDDGLVPRTGSASPIFTNSCKSQICKKRKEQLII